MLHQEPISFQITYILLALCMLTIPFSSFIFLPVGVVLWGISLVSFFKKENKTILKNRENGIFFAFFLLFFLLNFIGIFYSQNKTLAFAKIESYLWFFITPPLFLSLDSQKMTRKRVEILLYGFLISMALVMLVNYGISCKIFIETECSYHLFYTYLSHFMHPSYQALYACIALLFSFYFILKRKHTVLFLCFSIFLLLYIFMLQSKAGIFTSILFLIFAGLYWINRKKVKYFFSIIFVIILLVVPVTLIKSIDIKTNRVSYFMNLFKTNREKDVRILIWQNAWEVAVENLPFGAGTGDVHTELNKTYEANGFPAFQEKNYNAHNQYLETLVGIGILGLLSLLSLFFLAFMYGIKNRDILLPVFAGIVLFFFLFESMLERKAGGDFIALFMGLLFYNSSLKDREHSCSKNVYFFQ